MKIVEKTLLISCKPLYKKSSPLNKLVKPFLKARLDIYENQCAPLRAFYADKNILNRFSGSETNVIWPKVKEFLDTKDI